MHVNYNAQQLHFATIQIKAKGVDCQVEGTEKSKIPKRFWKEDEYLNLTVNAATGMIKNWPKGKSVLINVKCSDHCSVYFRNFLGAMRMQVENEYVPDFFGDGGEDYVELQVDERGHIKGWDPERIQDWFDNKPKRLEIANVD